MLFVSAPLMKSYLLFVTTIALVPPPFCQPANDMTQWPSCQPIKACILMKSDLKQWIKFLFHICFPNSNLLLIMLRLSALAKKFEWKYICFFYHLLKKLLFYCGVSGFKFFLSMADICVENMLCVSEISVTYLVVIL